MIPLGKPIEQILGGGALLLLALGCALVLRPFVSAILWAAVICFSTWPVYERCERAVGGNKILAAAMMTLLVALVLVAPFAVMAATLTDSVGNLLKAVNQILEQGPPMPPRWVAGLPMIGESLAAYWESLAHNAPAFTMELQEADRPRHKLSNSRRGGARRWASRTRSERIHRLFLLPSRPADGGLRARSRRKIRRIPGPRAAHGRGHDRQRRHLWLDRYGSRPGPLGWSWFLDCRCASGIIAWFPYLRPVVRAGRPPACVGLGGAVVSCPGSRLAEPVHRCMGLAPR